ncbi:hypothetical protein D9756_000608 [Leucocoprinus leucothites]|uniref:Uncharacterized protein n=1 Tax=Leucocoprinus leucothites TaxID=201217 RepID=A0A8H5LNI9_9AGAR|nr:hypothetical protein D9756_000608 [Leucoagaricus leucothites]
MSATPSPTASSVNIVRGTHEQLVAFLVLNVWPSHFGLPLLLAIVLFSKRIHRHITFINLCVAFIIIGVSSSLLLYAGSFEGPEPSQMLCLLQASLLYGMPGLSSMAALMLVLHMFLVIRAHYHGQEYLDRDHPLKLWAVRTTLLADSTSDPHRVLLQMAVSPYIVFFVCVLTTAAMGASHPERVSRNRRFFYCSLDSLPLTNTLTTVSAVILVATAVLEVWTIIILYRKWKIQRDSFPTRGALELSLPFRIITFGFYIIIALSLNRIPISLSLLSIKSPESPVPDLMIATAATVVMLVFGTQKDILRVLSFWNRFGPPKVKSLDSVTSSVDLKTEFPESDRTFSSPVRVTFVLYSSQVRWKYDLRLEEIPSGTPESAETWVSCPGALYRHFGLNMASRCSGVFRAFSRSSVTRWSRLPTHSRCLATAAAEPSQTSAPPATSNDPTLNRIVDDISGLTLLQAADLVTLLKSRLNIQEIALPAASVAPAAATATPAGDEAAAEKPQEKTVFTVKLESFDAGAKPKIIKEVKSLVPNLTLIEAKKFVESVPKVLKENLSKEEAEKLQKVFQDLGGVIKLE